MTRWDDYRRRVLYEDEGVVVLDKPSGIAVVGERHDADLVDLAADAGETVMPAHRIDKVTSGAVVFAKPAAAQASAAPPAEAGGAGMPAPRIARVPWGAGVFAKTAPAHPPVARQFHRRSIE